MPHRAAHVPSLQGPVHVRLELPTTRANLGESETPLLSHPSYPPPFRRYDPDDYHEQVSCGSKKCAKSGRKFGFTMYHASALAVKRAKEALRARLETEARARKQSARRAASADARGGGVCGAADELQAFSLGLRDCCPKCGEYFGKHTAEGDELRHLLECDDEEKIAQHTAAKAAAAESAAAAAAAEAADAADRAARVHAFVGLQSTHLLEDDALRRQCAMKGLGEEGDRAALVARLHDARAAAADGAAGAGAKRLTAGDGAASPRKRRRLAAADLPENLHALDADELREWMGAYGIAPCGESKVALVAQIEALVEMDTTDDAAGAGGARLRLTDGRAEARDDAAVAAAVAAATAGGEDEEEEYTAADAEAADEDDE